MVHLVKHDLEFILKQIKIAEAHSSGTPLSQIYVDANGNVVPAGTEGAVLAVSDPLTPYGLRTVNGSLNNLSGNRDEWGSADNPFVQITDPYWRDEDDDAMPFPGYVGPDSDNPTNQNNDYGDHGATNGSPSVKPGTVVDADPRIISNLIVDQTLDNPAAISAALMYAGYSGAELKATLTAIVNAKAALDAAIAAVETPAELAVLQAAVTAAQEALDAAETAAAAQIELAAQDQATLTEAQSALTAAQDEADAAIAAVTALLTDGIPNSQQQQVFDEAIALSDAKQTALQAAETDFADAQSAANASAAAVTAATGAAAAVLAAAQQALFAAQEGGPNVTAARDTLNTLLETHGVEMEGNTVRIPNVAPDEGLSAPYNSWFTLFGQFFDHGLDLVAKNGGTVYIPLQPDDPLYNPASPRTNFMVVTRTNPNADNLTTPWVDQNQTYGSTASKQLFMREYEMDGGKPVSTGSLLEGSRGLATWGDVKKQAFEKLGFELTDADVGNIPLFAMDQYGEFVPGPLYGLPQIIAGYKPDGSAILVEGNLTNRVNPSAIDLPDGTEMKGSGNTVITIAPGQTVQAVRTDHAFLDDIAHSAKMVNDRGQVLIADQDNVVGITTVLNPSYNAAHTGPATYLLETTQYVVANPSFDASSQASASNRQYLAPSVFWDNELLDAHYITGDGRGNENIGLSAVHHIFHSEHNRLVDQVKELALTSGDVAFLNEWLREDVTSIPTAQDGINALKWDGERLFQAARFTNEMEYQHLVFEEFARKVQPDVDAFVFNPSTDIDPAIFAEFAHVVYRFGHSMLNETVDSIQTTGADSSMKLFDAFLNPLAFGGAQVDAQGNPILGTNGQPLVLDHHAAAGAIVRGMTAQVGNEIDEFVTHVLRNQLVGIPLDLAAINIARGREAGIPPLNQARREFQEIANGDTQLEAYTSWTDFAQNLKNPASIVNFIAAYGTHISITSATTADAKRDAAMKLVFGGTGAPADRLDFLNATRAYAGGKLGGLEDVDLWVGGLAEKKMAFGGMLGSTFSFIFELQLENLQNADRFYYLSRVQGLNLLNELENNSLAKMVLNNTDLGATGYAVPGDIFSVPDHVLYVDMNMQLKFGHQEPVQEDPTLQALSPMVERRDSQGNLIEYQKNPDGTFVRDANGSAIPVDPAHTSIANYIRVNTNDHVLVQGTNGNDDIVAGGGDDSVWGMDGSDKIEAGYGVDKIHGGKGDDIITNSGTDIGEVDMLHGEEGNDVIHGGSGLALIFGNQGQDFIITGPDGKEAFGGTGNDFILGGEGGDFLLGNEGDDWIEAGNGFDTTAGDNSELFFNSTIIGHDVMFAGQNEHDFDAESGDDIMVQGESVMRNEGMWGFDWAIHKGSREAADADLLRPIFTTDQQDILRNRYDQVEALSGWNQNDVLKGDDRGSAVDGGEPESEGTGGLAGAEGTMARQELTQAGVDRIDGMRELLGTWVSAPTAGDREAQIAFDDGNILLGGGGTDIIEGRGGNDVIDGDSWLNVRIKIVVGNQVYSAESIAGKVYLASDFVEGVLKANAQPVFGGKTLDVLMLERALNPGQLSIVREIVKDDGIGDKDVAVFSGNRDEYTITRGSDGSILVSHTGFDPDNVPDGANLVSDGSDKLWNIEVLRFADGDLELTPPQLSLLGPTGGQYLDNFNSQSFGNSNGTTNWGPDWVETNDNGAVTTGQIRIDAGNGGGSNVLQFVGGLANNGSNGAYITRTVDLEGANTATLNYRANPDSLEVGESIEIQFAADGVNFVTLQTIAGNGADTPYSHLLTGPFSANSVVRIVGSAMNEANDLVSINDLEIEFTRPGAVNYETTYTEGGADADIALNPQIVEDSGRLLSARVVLINAQAGDDFDFPGNLPGNISASVDRSVPGRITVNLTGNETLANYRAAIQAIEFTNDSQNPSAVDRIIQVTVSDGIMDSNVATTTVNVAPVDDQVDAFNDTIVTTISSGNIVIPEWALLANDIDPDSVKDVIAVSNANGVGGLSLTTNPGSVTFTDTGTPGGSFTYTAQGQVSDTDNANVSVQAPAPEFALDDFSEGLFQASYAGNDGSVAFSTSWTETGDTGGAGGGDISIDVGLFNSRLQFNGSNTVNAGITGGEAIERGINLAGRSAATVSFSYTDDDLDANEVVFVEARNVTTGAWEVIGTLGGTATGNGTFNFSAALNAQTQIGANSAIRLRTQGNWDTGENFYVDNVRVEFPGNGDIVTGTGSQILLGDDRGTSFSGGTGDDVILAGGGDDTVSWVAENQALDGWDVVDGGTEGAAGDTFAITGNTSAETWRIYTVTEALLAVPGLVLKNPNSEIVITRTNLGSGTVVVAELTEIEEIHIQNSQVTSPNPGPLGGGDTFQVIGDFTNTSLRFNTITIEGDTGNDTVDISALRSAHRIVFKSNGGNDTIIGNLRPQDVIELPNGGVAADYDITTGENGVTTLTKGSHTLTFVCEGGLPQFGSGEGHDEEEETPPGNGGGDTGSGDDEENDDDACGHDDDGDTGSDDEGNVTPPPMTQPSPTVGAPIAGTNGTEVLVGTAAGETIMALDGNDNVVAGAGADVVNGANGNDFLSGEAGRDVMFGGDGDDNMLGGSDADMLYGEAGADRVFGDEGNDLIDAGTGNDIVYGGAGDDLIVTSAGDGNDAYYGDDMAGGSGIDTLDMSAITANITVNLGANGGSGSVFSSQSGTDTVWGVENIVTGSGNDTITANHAVNVIDGGAGNDTFRFLSAADASGDTILGFQPGDRLDLSAIDANTGAGGKQAFTLANGSSFTGPAQLVISHETRDDGDYTVVSGNTTGPDAAEFKISLKGIHDLKASDFVLS